MTPEEQNASSSNDVDTTPNDINSQTTETSEPSFSPSTPSDAESASTPSFASTAGSEIEPATGAASAQATQEDGGQSAFQQEQQPVSAAPSSLEPAPALGSQKKGKKGLVVGIIVAVLVVLLAAGSALAYNLWYQNPDKVLGDAVANLMTIKKAKFNGMATVKSSDVDVAVKFDGQGAEKSGGGSAELSVTGKSESLKSLGTIKLTADYVSSSKDGVYYFKLTNIKDAANKFIDITFESEKAQYKQYGLSMTDSQLAQQKKQLQQMISPLVSKIDNRWIKFSADDFNSSNSSNQTCMSDAIKQLQNNASERNEFVKVYREHSFINIDEKLGSKDGNLGYKVSFNEDESNRFTDALKTTTFGKAIMKCDSTILDHSESTSSDNKSKTSLQLWVSRWSHQLSEVKGTATSDGGDTKTDIDMKLNIGSGDNVQVPSDAVSIKDLTAEIEKLMGGGAAASSTSFSI